MAAMSKTTKEKRPRKAVVLAAGLGTRLRPLTDAMPKPLLPVWGEPMLERILRMLEEWGVEEIAVNAHHLSEKVRDYCVARKGEAKVTVSVEDEMLRFSCRNSKADTPLNSPEGGKKGGVGLENIRRRLNLIYDKQYSLKLKSEPDTYTVELALPLNRKL